MKKIINKKLELLEDFQNRKTKRMKKNSILNFGTSENRNFENWRYLKRLGVLWVVRKLMKQRRSLESLSSCNREALWTTKIGAVVVMLMCVCCSLLLWVVVVCCGDVDVRLL